MICEFIKMREDGRFEVGVNVKGISYSESKTWAPARTSVIARNQNICNMDGKLGKENYEVTINFPSTNNNYLIKFFDPTSNSIETAKSVVNLVGSIVKNKSLAGAGEVLLPKICDLNSNEIGKVEYMREDNYNYLKITVKGVELNCYTVGLGRKGIYICIYNNQNQLVAIVSKKLTVRNGRSQYTMYMVSDEWCEYITIVTEIIHQMDYEEHDQNANTIVGNTLNTWQKGLLAKYDPNFISGVIAREDPSNLPENMPLVKEMKHQAQTNPRLMIKRIMTILTFLIIAIFFFLAFTKKI